MEKKLETKILRTIREFDLLAEGDKVFVGFSGGADSCVLLDVLNEHKAELGITVTALHVNHCIRGHEADLDEIYCKEFCEERGIRIFVTRRDAAALSKAEKLSVEEAGRMIRYAYFEEMANGAKIAAAHHKNDVAETMIMRFFRGSGLKGLCGIPIKNGSVIRPLLFCGREEIERYCENHGIRYRTDSTNLEPDYTRNKIRNFYIKRIEEDFNPGIVDALFRMRRVFDEDEAYLEQQAELAYKKHCIQEHGAVVLDQKVAKLPKALAYRVLRKSLSEISGSRDIGQTHIELVFELFSLETGKILNLPRGAVCEKKYGVVEIRAFAEEAGETHWEYPLKPDSRVFAAGKCFLASFTKQNIKIEAAFDYEKIKNGLAVRNRRDGDSIYFNKVGTKKLKNYFIDKKIAREIRDKIALICSGSEVLMIEDGVLNERYTASDSTKKFLYISVWEDIHAGEHKSLDFGN